MTDCRQALHILTQIYNKLGDDRWDVVPFMLMVLDFFKVQRVDIFKFHFKLFEEKVLALPLVQAGVKI